MQNVETIFSNLSNTFWVSSKVDAVYSIRDSDLFLIPNSNYPVQFTIKMYTPGAYTLADVYHYQGSVALNGTILIGGLNGILSSDAKTIQLSNGEIWTRVDKSNRVLVGKYNPEIAKWIANQESDLLRNRMNTTYPLNSNYQPQN